TYELLLFSAISIFAFSVSADLTTTSFHDHISFACHKALNPESCRDTVLRAVSDDGSASEAADLQPKLLNRQVDEMRRALVLIQKLRSNQAEESGALSDCEELMEISIDLVLNSIRELEKGMGRSQYTDAQTWLSGVLTNHFTCADEIGGGRLLGIRSMTEGLIDTTRASLAVLASVTLPEDEITIRPVTSGMDPTWLTPMDRKLLQVTADRVKADLVVARDGSGDFRTVSGAVDAAPENSEKRFVIRVKKGTYRENVVVGKNKKNLMIIGDGKGKTTITAHLNVVDGSTTYNSATLAAVGEGFILQDIRIRNTAGREKAQAVALRIGSDKSAINRCKIEGYQDTLYAHSLRQFYRDSTIKGTIDFIFGDAAVVLQKCTIEARIPLKSQKNTVTAQGRSDPNQNTGTSIQDCVIKPTRDLEPLRLSYPTFLGRPWRNFSRTAVLESYIGDHVDPAGWFEWSGDFALDTLYYGEYKNRGPGSVTENRVNWKGYHAIDSAAEAWSFTVRELINGDEWLGYTGVPYNVGL
ncbi:hypothetical protein M569_11757, partial [Genlisea aurea]